MHNGDNLKVLGVYEKKIFQEILNEEGVDSLYLTQRSTSWRFSVKTVRDESSGFIKV
jgi:hypothetical protein